MAHDNKYLRFLSHFLLLTCRSHVFILSSIIPSSPMRRVDLSGHACRPTACHPMHHPSTAPSANCIVLSMNRVPSISDIHPPNWTHLIHASFQHHHSISSSPTLRPARRHTAESYDPFNHAQSRLRDVASHMPYPD